MSVTLRWRPAEGGFEIPTNSSTFWANLMDGANTVGSPVILDRNDLPWIVRIPGAPNDALAVIVHAILTHGEIFIEGSY